MGQLESQGPRRELSVSLVGHVQHSRMSSSLSIYVFVVSIVILDNVMNCIYLIRLWFCIELFFVIGFLGFVWFGQEVCRIMESLKSSYFQLEGVIYSGHKIEEFKVVLKFNIQGWIGVGLDCC